MYKVAFDHYSLVADKPSTDVL